jgi:hypothetical protein
MSEPNTFGQPEVEIIIDLDEKNAATKNEAREQNENIRKVPRYASGGVIKKDTNPKDAVGTRRAGLSAIPRPVLYEVGLAMLEGALKYGRHNYRIAGVRASVYYDAVNRHLDDWWEGQDYDPNAQAKLHHISKAIAGLCVMRDSIMAGNWVDDRPPTIAEPGWVEWFNAEAEKLIDSCKHPKRPYVKGDNE